MISGKLILKQSIMKNKFSNLAVISFALCVIANILHYTNIFPNSSLLWVSYIASCVFMLLATLKKKAVVFPKPDKIIIWILVAITAIFLASHLMNFSTAPWNGNGVFDDAAWDIYYAKDHIFNEQPFQAAFFDEVGIISREVVFHYYITIFFKVFGYNLLTFNLSLLLLGYITVIFTSLIVKRLTKSNGMMLLAGLIMNFLPLYFMQTFIGHRYVIIPPLITMASYFLIIGFEKRSKFLLFLSALFAAFAWDSGVMGKQYLYAIIATGIVLFAIKLYRYPNNRKIPLKLTRNLRLVRYYIYAFILTAAPLWLYVLFNYNTYVYREQALSAEFIEALRIGWQGMEPYTLRLLDCLFAESAFTRQFVDTIPIPLIYYLFAIIGSVIAIIKKRYELILIVAVAFLGAFVSGAYDFRILHAASFIVVLVCLGIWACYKFIKKKFKRLYILKWASYLILGLIIAVTLVGNFVYIWNKSQEPLSVWHLNHIVTYNSRFVRDIVAGIDNPSIEIRDNELLKLTDVTEPSYDSLVCQSNAYAVVHLFLQDYDSKKILSFCDNTGFNFIAEDNILDVNIRSVEGYSTNKDLLLIWEISDKTQPAIEYFMVHKQFGEVKNWGYSKYGIDTNFIGLLIPHDSIQQLKEAIVRK